MGVASARLVMVLVLGALAPVVEARPITVEFEAVVTEVVDEFDLLPGVESGSVVRGTYLYDDSVVPTGASERGGVFDFAKFGDAGFEFTVGDSTFEFRNESGPEIALRIGIGDDIIRGIGPDRYTVRWADRADPIVLPPVFDTLMVRNLVDLVFDGDLFRDVSFDSVPLPPSLERALAVLSFTPRAEIPTCPPNALCPSPTESRFSADLTLLRVVPEPTAFMLLGIALAALLGARAVRAGAGR